MIRLLTEVTLIDEQLTANLFEVSVRAYLLLDELSPLIERVPFQRFRHAHHQRPSGDFSTGRVIPLAETLHY